MLQDLLKKIGPLDEKAMAAAAQHHDQLAMPYRSLGQLHEVAIRLAGIRQNPRPVIKDLAMVTMAGDHGVAAQNVSLYPKEVTAQMVANFLKGGAAINVLARHFGIRLTVVDIGVAAPIPKIEFTPGPDLRFLQKRITDGTQDISQGPAMTTQQAQTAIEIGIEVFEKNYANSVDAVGTGDMGIANTTPSAAIAAAILKRKPMEVVNRGTGIDDEALKNKAAVVARSLEVNQPDPNDPLDILAKVGGYEIGGIAGVILGACARRVPVVIDGFISTAAALIASRFHPEVKNYLFAGHQSAVEGHALMLADLKLTPLVNLGMRLGEGTGATFGLSILAAASAIATQMLTFEEAAVSGPAESH